MIATTVVAAPVLLYCSTATMLKIIGTTFVVFIFPKSCICVVVIVVIVVIVLIVVVVVVVVVDC